MKKFFKFMCAVALTFALMSGMSPTIYAEESTATLTWLNEQYIWVDEGNHYYLTDDGTFDVPLEDANNDGINDITGEPYDQLYSSKEFEDPIAEPPNGWFAGSQLATYSVHSTSLPSEMTFEVYGQDGIESLTINTASTNTIKLGYDIVRYSTGAADYLDTSLYIWEDNVAYEIVGSSFTFDGSESTWVVPYSTNGSDYIVTFDKISGQSSVANVVIEDVTNVTPPTTPSTGDGETNDDTKVVNGPASANVAIVIATFGTTAAATLATINRRRK